MNEHDPLHEAVKALKDCDVPDGPPEQTVAETLAALEETAEDWNAGAGPVRFVHASAWGKWAVAAGVMILLGFSVGRFTTPKTLNEVQIAALETRLRASLEPAITQQIGQGLSRDLQAIQRASYTTLNEAWDERLRREMQEYAVQILAASNASTNQLMDNLVQGIRMAQAKEHQRLAAIFNKIEFDRLKEDSEVRKSLASVTYLTENYLQTTQELLTLIAHEQTDDEPQTLKKERMIP